MIGLGIDDEQHEGKPGQQRLHRDASAYPEAALLRAAYDAMGEAVLITGPDLDPPGPQIEYVNTGFIRLTGYSSDEVVGRSPRFLQGPATDRAVLDRLRAALGAGNTFHGSTINYRKDGTEYEVEWLITPVHDATERVVHWVAVQRDITERKRAEEHLRRLLHEVNHRVNNTLAAVQSLAVQTLRSSAVDQGTRSVFLSRLFALSRVHEILVSNNWLGAPLRGLAKAQLGHLLDGNAARAALQGPEVWLRPGAAVTLGLALHELAANARAHGALSTPSGHVSLEWSIGTEADSKRLNLVWTEADGPPLTSSPMQGGFGIRLLERGLPAELQARVNLKFEPAGMRCDIGLPTATVVEDIP